MFLLVAGFATGSWAKKRVHTFGDSTCSTYNTETTNKRGWGQLLQNIFDAEAIECMNWAKSGATAATFYTNQYPTAKNSIAAGDYVLIQFGHNDEKVYTEDLAGPTAYRQNLKTLIDAVRGLGATPIMVTSICRNMWTGDTISLEGRHDTREKVNATTLPDGYDYPKVMRDLAAEEGLYLLDMTTATKELFEDIGQGKTTTLFASGDQSHTNATGGDVNCRLVGQLLTSTLPANHELVQALIAENIVVPDMKDVEEYVSEERVWTGGSTMTVSYNNRITCKNGLYLRGGTKGITNYNSRPTLTWPDGTQTACGGAMQIRPQDLVLTAKSTAGMAVTTETGNCIAFNAAVPGTVYVAVRPYYNNDNPVSSEKMIRLYYKGKSDEGFTIVQEISGADCYAQPSEIAYFQYKSEEEGVFFVGGTHDLLVYAVKFVPTPYIDLTWSELSDYTTFYSSEATYQLSDVALTKPDAEGEVYVVSAVTESGVPTLTKIADNIVPKGTAVVLKGSHGETYRLMQVADQTYDGTNLLRGTDGATTLQPTDGGSYNHVFTTEQDYTAFMPIATATAIAANTAYLQTAARYDNVLLSGTIPSENPARKHSVFIYAGQSNADGREYTQNLPGYMLDNGSLPSSPYQNLNFVSVCGHPEKTAFGQRTFNSGERYAFCDVTNYWIDQSEGQPFYAIKCAYGGTAIAPGVTAEKLPIWYADAEWMQTHYAYKNDDITQPEYAAYNSLTKDVTEGFASLVDGTLAALDNGYDVKAIMWHQGESDRSASGQYYTNFKTMIAYMRNAIYEKTGDPADLQLPFIFGTVSRRSTQYNATVEAAQKQVAEEDPNCYVIDMKNATLLSDNLHFDRQATEYLGKKMYNQLVQLGLAEGAEVEVEEFYVAPSVMDDAEVTAPYEKTWDFSAFSQETKDNLAADVALESGSKWNYNSGWGYRRTNGVSEEQLKANDVVIAETDGLYFTGAQGNRITLNTSSGYLGLVDGSVNVFLPKLLAGQLIEVTARANKNTVTLKPGLDMDSYLEVVGDATVGTTYQTVTLRVRYNVTLPTHIAFSTNGGTFIQKIELKTPETVNILIGADQKETFACDQPLDFSPFTDLFKAYVVTGYDDTAGKIDCEQVLQVPANTGVLLVGEESTVNVPVIEGTAPDAPIVNLLTAVVGNGQAPAGSFVLTTSGDVTQFTQTATAANLTNQAYIASLGTLSAYGFNYVEPRAEHVYNIADQSILAKSTTLTFGTKAHHTATYNSKGIGFYTPNNADGLDRRFAFDNSGKWQTDGTNGSLGTTYKDLLYASVVELQDGDRIKLEFTSNATVKVLNGALRGVEAGTALTSGTTYVVQTNGEETINVDFTEQGSSNRQGLTKMTVWTDSEVAKPAYEGVTVAKYDGNRQAAVTYTFDDGIQDQYTLAYPEMKKRGIRATFGIIGSKVGGTISASGGITMPAMTWDQIREMYADGFEIASHGYEHKNLTSLGEEARQAEVNLNDDLIEQEVGQRPLTFIYPYNGKNDEIQAWVESTRIGSRTYQQSFGGSASQLTMNSYVDGLIDNGSWGVTMTHSIADGYDHFQDPERLYSHWDYVASLKSKLWVAPFCEVAAYVKERDNATIELVSEDDGTIVISISTTLNQELFRQPLTLMTETYATAATQDGNDLEVVWRNGQTIINGVNPNGGNITIVKSASAPLEQTATPTVSVTLGESLMSQSPRRAVVTLSGAAGNATYYYKEDGDAAWTAISGTTFVPAAKGVYTFKAVADGYSDSEATLPVAVAPYYAASQMVDLTDLDLYAASINGTDAFSWGDDWGFDATQEFGKISSPNIGGIAVQNSNLAARYSYAKGIGLANNYGYSYATNIGSPYSFAEYELYQNHSLTDVAKNMVHNPTTVAVKFPSQTSGALKGVTIYEPMEKVSVTITDTGYATFCCEAPLSFAGSGVEAYYATADGDDVSFSTAIDNPAAQTGLLLKGAPGTHELMLATEGTDVSSENLLKPCFEEKTVGTTEGCDYGKVFILSRHDGKLGFFRSDNGRKLLAGKSYLYLENVSGARAAIGFPLDGTATAVQSVATPSQQTEAAYNLKGQRTTAAKGLYIIGGKKSIIK